MVKYTSQETKQWLEIRIKETKEKLKYLEDRYYNEVIKGHVLP